MPFCPRSSVRSERHRAKVEVAGAIPAVDAILPLCLRSHRASFVNSYTSVRVRPEAPFHVGHDVTVASRPVTAPVRVQIPLANPISNLIQTSSRFAVREAGPAHWLAHARFESARWLKTNSIGWRREKSHHGPEQRDQRASAAQKRLCENCSARFSRRWTVVSCSGLQFNRKE